MLLWCSGVHECAGNSARVCVCVCVCVCQSEKVKDESMRREKEVDKAVSS